MCVCVYIYIYQDPTVGIWQILQKNNLHLSQGLRFWKCSQSLHVSPDRICMLLCVDPRLTPIF